jgi:protein TonB
MQQSSRLKNHLKASAWAMVGLVLVYGGVVAMNELAQRPVAKAEIQFQKVPKLQQKKSVEKEQRPKPQVSRHNPPPAPFAGLGSELSGVNFGIPEPQIGEFGAPSDQLLGDTGDVTMTGETVDVPPKPARQEPVAYPKQAKQKGIEGYVVLSLLIKENGIVEQVRVLEARPAGVFEDAALDGVRSWIFQPARYQGRAVRVWARQKIQFQLS